MEYQLTAELASPPEAPDLDPLQQVGVVSLLDERLNNLASIEGPDGMEIVPVEHSIEAHLGGAVVNWLLDAPALVFAEDATRSVLEQLIDEIDLLAGWEVKHCAVTATDDQLASALAVSLDPDEFPDGLPSDLDDTGHLVAWTETIGYNVRKVGGWKSTLFSGPCVPGAPLSPDDQLYSGVNVQRPRPALCFGSHYSGPALSTVQTYVGFRDRIVR